MSDEIKAGDTAVLKSGSPPMTVTSIGDHYGEPTAWCSWFDGKKPCNATFPLVALKKS
jgi:uncharacterized protein YodC (DUF2158 family)